jgi:hypothetical protein
MLILLFLIQVTLFIHLWTSSKIRESLLKSFLITFFLILLGTEILSLFNRITFEWIRFFWIGLNSLVFCCLVLLWTNRDGSIINIFKRLKEGLSNISGRLVIICLVLISFILLITLTIAIKSPPNNFDSMTYHMARIPHWIQNQSVRFYPTAIPRQNYSSPLAEFGILHVQLLSGNDIYANLVQWFSFLMSILTASIIAREYGAKPRAQWITAALVASLPLAILQSSSTQNDLVAGIFCFSFAYFLTRVARDQKWEDLIFSGLSLGLALATKGTAYVFCAGIGISIAGYSLFRKRFFEIKDLVLRYFLIVMLGLVLNTGIFLRNWGLYQHPLITSNQRIFVEEISPGIVAANLVRNGASHFASPLEGSNLLLSKGVGVLLGSELNNPASTFEGSEFELSFSINENDSGNLVHAILLTLSVVAFPFLKREGKKDQIPLYLSLILSMLLFSIAFKWQPWGARLQATILLLGCVVIGLLSDLIRIKRWILSPLILVILITSSLYMFNNSNRPFFPLWSADTIEQNALLNKLEKSTKGKPIPSRIYKKSLDFLFRGRSIWVSDRHLLYFLSNFSNYQSYRRTRNYLLEKPYREVGLIMHSNHWEYPLWAMIGAHASQGEWQINHIQVEDISAQIPNDINPTPELVLTTKDDAQDLPFLADYELVIDTPKIMIWKRLTIEN